jgi:DNA-binding MarR family transcriptional regulator
MMTEALAPLGLAPAQFGILLELWSKDGLTQRDLVLRLDLEQATVANTLARMERDKLIVRHPDVNDARAQTIRLTERARALEKPATNCACEVNTEALAGLSAAERNRLLETMRRVIETQRRHATIRA